MHERSPPIGPFRHLTDAERQDSLRETLERAPTPTCIWVFAYGALLWDPCVRIAERRAARLQGYSRAFSIFTVEARGTPESPGLALALQPGGVCEGAVLRIAEAHREEDLGRLWSREMWTGIYSPTWVRVSTPQGDVSAVAFVLDPTHPQYAGDLPPRKQADLIRSAHGELGSCRDYLANTVAALRTEGFDEPRLTALLELVDSEPG